LHEEHGMFNAGDEDGAGMRAYLPLDAL
jgi:hypothetical protein